MVDEEYEKRDEAVNYKSKYYLTGMSAFAVFLN